MKRTRVAVAAAASVVAVLSVGLRAEAAGVRVRCEVQQDPPRARINVDAFDLVPANGNFAARVVSGLNSAQSGLQAAVGGEVAFDFDSDAGDILAGSTPIAANFIQNAQASGQILDANGNIVAAATAQCAVR